MNKAERGTKRVCGACGAKFYDLNKDPIVCPVCETVYVAKETAPRAKAAPAVAEKETEEVEAPEAAVEAGPEIVSLSEVEEETDDDVDIDDAGIDLGDDDDAELPDNDDSDDTFLEDDDEEGSDVTDIIPVKSESEEP